MAQKLLNDLRVHVFGQQHRRTGVPEVMEADVGESGLLQERGEAPLAQVGGVYRAAGAGGKDMALILVEVPQTLHVLHLTREVQPESLYGPRCDADGPAALPSLGLS